MSQKLTMAWRRFGLFCATQYTNFMVGMVMAVLSLLTLTVYIPLWISAGVCPLMTLGLYMFLRYLVVGQQKWREIREDVAAVLLGSLYVLIFLVL